MSTATVTVRVDRETKEAATRIAEDFGFDLSSITRAFYRQIVREQRIPLTLEYPTPNTESLESIREAEAVIASGKTRFESANDMYASLGI
jgi:DNA-damage-inducible protein J